MGAVLSTESVTNSCVCGAHRKVPKPYHDQTVRGRWPLPKPAGPLPLRRLGKTELRVSAICLGGVGLGGAASGDLYGGISDEQAIATVHRAIEAGINFIDTSPLYRESERRIGLALEALPAKTRAKVMIGTKVGDDCPPWSDNGGHSPFSAKGVWASIQHSLKLLRVVKRLETVLLHDPTLAELDEFFAVGGGMEALLALQKQGVVGHIGLGVREHEVHSAFLNRAPAAGAVLLTVNDFNLLRRSVASTSWVEAASQDVGILNAGAFYMGLLADPEHSWKMGFKASLDRPELTTLARKMARWCDSKGVSLRTVAVRFALSHPNVGAVPIGCRSPDEVDEVIESAMTPLPDGLLAAFCAEFDAQVEALTTNAHWYYSKASSAIGDSK